MCKTCNLDPLNRLTDDLRAARNGNADKPDIDAIVESVVTNNAYVHSILEKLGVSAAEPSAAPREIDPVAGDLAPRSAVDSMPAAVYTGDGHLAVQEVALPAPRPGEALVEVSHCGICGTDLHLVLERYARPGSVLGHEWAGTVRATGSDADTALIGLRVVANPTPGCGECRACRRGRPSVCLRKHPPDHLDFRGAFTRYVIVDAARLLQIPAGLQLRTAALTEPTAIALHTVNLSGVEPSDRVLITGAGPVGLLTLAVLRTRATSKTSRWSNLR